MEITEKDFEIFQKNELKPDSTFQFNCKMCGNCCRKRDVPILITGADVYRIASALSMSMREVVEKNTAGYVGDTSHAPVLVLKERDDGSCSLLRKGRCMVHQNKPVVCVLFPLGRLYDFRDMSFHYFMNPSICASGGESEHIWTLKEWLANFEIEDTERMTEKWNKLVAGLTKITTRMKKEKISGRLLDIIFSAMYLNYDMDKPYVEQVDQQMSILKIVLKEEFGIKISF